MSQLSFATAKALKDAGFPRPKAEPGQMWYIKVCEGATAGHSALCICVLDSRRNLTFVNFNPIQDAPTYLPLYDDRIFAPNPDYILPLIGDNALIKFRKDETSQIFECNIDEGDGREMLLGYHETNPAEAAAMAWLMINEICRANRQTTG